jgi:hypothetical protein
MSVSDYKFVLKFAKKIILLNDRSCEICGNNNIECLDFHHVIGEKEKTISEMSRSRLSTLMAETEKCIVLCKNCHNTVHFYESKTKYAELKKKMLELKGGVFCSKCEYKENISSLDFHHREKETKDFNLSNAYAFLTTKLDKIIEELDKCDILCRNCHATEHFDKEKFKRLLPEIEDKVMSYKELKVVSHEDVKKMHSSGFSNADISRGLNCSEASIVYILKKYELKTNTITELFPKCKICLFCKKEFNVFDSRAMKNRKYCSWKCMHDSKIKLYIPKDEFENMLKEKNIVDIAKLHNVSIKAVTNLAIRYGMRKE